MIQPQNAQKAEEIKSNLREDLKESLKSYANVKSLGYGFREKDGELTNEVVIQVFVDEKLDEEVLNDGDIVPHTVDGYKVDVIEANPQPIDSADTDRSEELRPLPSGVGLSAGSMGWVGTDGQSRTVGLTNEHVASEGQAVGQGGSSIGTVIEDGSSNDTGVDASLVEIDGTVDTADVCFGLGDIGSWESPQLDSWYVMNGKRTGFMNVRCITVGDGLDDDDRYARPEDGGQNIALSGNSGSCVGRVDSQGVFHPASLLYGSTNSAVHAVSLESLNTLWGPFSNGTNNVQPDSSGSDKGTVGEVHFHTSDADESMDSVTLDMFVSHLGPDAPGAVETRLLDLNGDVIIAQSHEITNYDYVSWDVDISYTEYYDTTVQLQALQDGSVVHSFDHVLGSAGPPYFHIESASTNSPVLEGDLLQAEYEIRNNGGETGTQDITLDIDSTQEDIHENVEADPYIVPDDRVTGTLTWDTTGVTAGEYTATVSTDDETYEETITLVDELTPISTPQELQDIDNNLAGNYEIVNDLDMAGFSWDPISGDVSADFTGQLFGNGYEIQNLEFDLSARGQQGLFDTVDGATLDDIHIRDFTVPVTDGDVFGFADTFEGESQIRDCSVVLNDPMDLMIDGQIFEMWLFGDDAAGCSFERCSVEATITSNVINSGISNIGGFMKMPDSGSVITECRGSVNISQGGEATSEGASWPFIGSGFGDIYDSYSDGVVEQEMLEVELSNDFGGFVSGFFGDAYRCYTSVDLYIENAEDSDVGGFAANDLTTFHDCYWDQETSRQTDGVGANGDDTGLTPLTTAEMTGEVASENMTGFDFDEVWLTQENTYSTLRSLFAEAFFDVVIDEVRPGIIGEPTEVDFTVTNDGEAEGTQIIRLFINEIVPEGGLE